MSEALLPAERQEDRNLELLRRAELGVILERVYIEAMNLDPRLKDVEITPVDESDGPSIARARPAWESASGRHEVRVRLDDLDDALARTGRSLEGIPGAKELFARKLGIPAEAMTPQMLYVFGLAHELGHVTEFMDYETNPEELRRRNKREKQALPIGNATVSAIMTEGTPAHSFVNENWEEISRELGVGTIEELLGMQHTAYRGMTTESNADNFADGVFRLNPTIVDQMMSPNLDDYRNFPIAA